MDGTIAQCFVSASESAHTAMMAANNSETCAMVGDADLYGIGIRLGFYLQWIITLVVTYNALDYEMLHRTITIILQLGLFSIMLLHTTTRSLRAADAAIGFWLLFGALVSLAADGSAFGVLSGIVRMAFYTLLSGYEAWLWFGGIDALAARRPHTRADGAACDTVVFFGGATAENEAFRGLARTAAIIGVLVFFSLMVKRIYEAREKAAQGREDGPGGPNGWLVLLSVTMIVVSIVAIEHLIRANQMVGLGSLSGVDQLIPFLIGLFGLLDTLLKMSMGQGEVRVPVFPVWDLGSLSLKRLCAERDQGSDQLHQLHELRIWSGGVGPPIRARGV